MDRPVVFPFGLMPVAGGLAADRALPLAAGFGSTAAERARLAAGVLATNCFPRLLPATFFLSVAFFCSAERWSQAALGR